VGRSRRPPVTPDHSDGWTMAGLCDVHGTPRQKNGVCPKCYFRAWYERNRASVLTRVEDWKRDNRSAHLELKRRWWRKRRLALRGQPIGTYTERDVFDRYGLVCYICRLPIDLSIDDRSRWRPELDHVIPISRGGTDSLENVRPVHRGCNSHKGRKLLSEMAA